MISSRIQFQQVVQDAPFVDAFWKREKASEKKASPASPQVLTELLGSGKGVPDFLNGRKLRDYQLESFKWMVQHALTNSSCILGDEMGLGKTAQVWSCILPQHFCSAASLCTKSA